MTSASNGGRIVPSVTNTPPPAHKHNVTDLVGMDGGSIPSGAVPTYSPGSGWVPTVPTTTRPSATPNAPVFTARTVLLYSAVDTSTSVLLVTKPQPPTLNTDGTSISGVASYVMRWRYEDPNLTTTSQWNTTPGLPSSTTITSITLDSTLSYTITSVAQSGSTSTVTTSAAHNFYIGDVVTVTGSAGNNGDWTITSVPTTVSFTYINASGANQSGGTVSARILKANTGVDHRFIAGTATVLGDSAVITGSSTAANNRSWNVRTTPANNSFTFAAGANLGQTQASSGTVATTVLTAGGIRPNTPLSVQMACIDVYNNQSDWSAATTVTTTKDSTPPATPNAPSVVIKLGGIEVQWDGTSTDSANGYVQPTDYAYTDLFISSSSGFFPSASTRVGRFSGAFTSLVAKDPSTGAKLVYGTPYYIRLISYDATGNASTATTSVTATPKAIQGAEIETLSVGQLTAGTLNSTLVAAGQISTSVLDDPTYWPVITYIPQSGNSTMTVTTDRDHGLSVNNWVTIAGTQYASNSGFFKVTEIVAARIFRVNNTNVSSITNSDGQGTVNKWQYKVTLDSGGIRAFRGSGVTASDLTTPTVSISSLGSFSYYSNTSTSVSRLSFDASGLYLYSAGSTNPDISLIPGGTSTFSGSITASTITGTNSIIGATIKTSSANLGTANTSGVIIDSAGLRAYAQDTTSGATSPISTLSIDAATGAAVFRGSITSSTITSGSITGASYKTAASGTRLEISSVASQSFVTMYSGSQYEAAGASISSEYDPIYANDAASGTLNFTQLYERLFSPSAAAGLASQIRLLGTGYGTGNPTAKEPYGRNPRIEFSIDTNPSTKVPDRYKIINLAHWNRSTGLGGTLTDPAYVDTYTGLMDYNGYYILMKSHSDAFNTYLSSGPGGTTTIRANGNHQTNQIVISSAGGVQIDGNTSLSSNLSLTSGNLSVTGTVTATGTISSPNLSASTSISSSGTISAAGRIIPSEHIAPASTNASFLGLDLNRWKGVYSYIGDFSTTLTVGGAATFNSTLGVTGYATFSNGMSVGANFIAGGTLATNSDCYVSGNLYGVGGLTIYPTSGALGLAITGTSASGNVYPTTSAYTNLGLSGYRWAAIYSSTAVNVASDSRVKTDVATISDSGFGITFLRKLRPVSYRRTDLLVKTSTGDYQIGTSTDVHTGFIAQEIGQALTDIGVSEWSGWTPEDPADSSSIQSLRYEQLISPIVSAIQNIDARLTALETK